MLIVATMFVLGIIVGFVGAGGAGFVIALLTLLFDVPIHTALGTSLVAMVFTTISGALSHYRAGNVHVKTGLIVGVIAALGAFAGSQVAAVIPETVLPYFTSVMLFLSSLLVLLKLYVFNKERNEAAPLWGRGLWVKATMIGLITGLLSGSFGIGSAPFIQLGLLVVLGLTIRQSVGTTMLVIVPIAIGGGAGYVLEGFVDPLLLLKVVTGSMAGAYIGAKFTRLAPTSLLRAAVVLTPFCAAILLLL